MVFFFIYFFYNFIFYLYIIDFYINWIFLFCNSAFEQGHLDTWRYKNALIIIIIIISKKSGSIGIATHYGPGYRQLSHSDSVDERHQLFCDFPLCPHIVSDVS